MTQFLWRLPLDGDGHTPDRAGWTRGDHGNVHPLHPAFARTGLRDTGFTWYDQLVQIARAAELTGFDGVHLPQSRAGEEPLVTAGALAREVRRLTLLPAVPPLLAPVYAAKIATSFQRLTGDRLALHLTALPDEPKPWHGRRWSQDEQVARIGEFLDVFRGFWSEPDFTYRGRYYEVEKGGFAGPLAGRPLPAIHLAAESEAALALAARHADVVLLPLAPLAEVRTRIAAIRAAASAFGRAPAVALTADVVARHDPAEAAAHARRSWNDAAFAPIDDTLWRGDGTSVLVGSHTALAARLADYAEAGVDRFILSARPHLEEAYRIGEHLLPLARTAIAARAIPVAA